MNFKNLYNICNIDLNKIGSGIEIKEAPNANLKFFICFGTKQMNAPLFKLTALE